MKERRLKGRAADSPKSESLRCLLYPSEECYAVSAPSLPGCWSQGATREEALANIADAVREYLAAEAEPLEGAEIRETEVAV